MRHIPVLRALALAILVIASASVALGELRRPTVREIDLLVALVEAEVPVELWAATDGPFDRYRAVVAEREAAWSRQPPLQRRIERPEESDLLRREQRRRGEQLLSDQRTLIAELRGALAQAAEESDVPIDGRIVDGLALWLEARIAGRLAESTRDGMLPPSPLPLPLAMGLSSEDRLAAQRALVPHLRPYIAAAEAFFDAHLESSPAVPPTDAEHRVLPGFSDVIGGGYEARRATAPPLVARSAAAHLAVLAALPESRRAAARSGMFRTLELNAHIARRGRSVRMIAERVSGLDDAARQRLVDARLRLEAMLAEEEQAALDRLSSYSDADFARGGSVGAFWERFREAESAYDAVAQDVLGDRFRALLRAGWSSPNADESVRALVDPDRFEEVAAIDDPSWQLRRISLRRPASIHWRPTTTLGGLSTASRARLEALAPDGSESKRTLIAAADRHAERWRTQIEPEQARLTAEFPGVLALPMDEAAARAFASIESSIASLRRSIASIEAELAEAIRAAGVDPLRADEWVLLRAVELLAPETTDARLGLELLPTSPTILAVIEGAGIDPSAADLARSVGFVHAETLERVLWKRQTWLDGLSIWMARRARLQAAVMDRPVGDPSQRAAQEELDGIARRCGLADGDPAALEAWDAIHADWRAALAPEPAEALRRAWLRATLPELWNEAIPVDALLGRLRSADAADAARGVALETLAAAHRAARSDRALIAADAIVRTPISLERWSLDLDFGRRLPLRDELIERYRSVDRDAGLRTLRRAIAIVGVEAASEEPALLGALLREVPSMRLE